MLQFPQLVTQLGQGGAALGGATAGQPYYFNASRQVESVQATCSMRLTETAAPPRQIADLAAQAGTPTMPPPPAAAAAAVATAAAAAPPPPAKEQRADDYDYLRPRPARPAEPAQPAPVAAMRPPAFADPAALGGMPHWFSPPAFAKPAPAAPAPLPAAAPSGQARYYSMPHANVFTVPPVPAHRRAAAQQATAQQVKLDSSSSSSSSAVGLRGDPSPRIDVSHLAALSAVPDAALSARFAAAVLQHEQANAARAGAPRAAPSERDAPPNHDAALFAPAAPPPSPHAARSPYALPAYGASGASPFAAPPFAAPPGGCGAASSPSCLLDSLTVEEFVSLRSSREREFSSRELVDLTCEPTPWTGASEPNPWTGANSLDSTLLEDAGRLNLSSFTGLAGLLDAL